MGRILRVTSSDRYEVSDKGRVWKDGPKRRGPIPELRIPVHGFSWGAGYRAFLRVATPSHAASCFGVFIKLLEVGANADLDERWLIQPRDRLNRPDGDTGYLGIIADEIGFSSKAVEKATEVLTHPEVAWLEWVEIESNPRNLREFPEKPALLGPCAVLPCSVLTCTDTKKTVSENKTISKSDSPDAELLPWLEWWNELHRAGMVPSGVKAGTPSDAVTAAWKRSQSNTEAKAALADRDALHKAIEEAAFIHRKGWFTLAKLFGGKNSTGELIAQNLLNGAYRDDNRHGRPEIEVGPGQRHREPGYGDKGTF